MKQDQDEYVKAFRGEDEAPAMMSEDAADGATETPAVAVVIDPEAAVEDAGIAEEVPAEEVMPEGEEATMAMAEEELPLEGGGEMPAEVAGEDAMTPEDIQRQKSWEGRLRKREEELAAREAALTEAPAEESDGDIAEIRQRLAEDFGDEFVTMITAIAAAEAKKLAEKDFGERVGSVTATIDRLIADTQSAFQNMHYAAIADAHEDFMDIADSQEFKTWLESMPEDARAQKVAVIETGSAGKVIKLLNEYKEYCKQKDEGGDDLALDAASGVRSSSPVRLPSRSPVGADEEYKAAWSQM